MTRKHAMLWAAILCACGGAFGEPAGPDENRLAWWDDIPGFLNQQHRHSLDAAAALLQRFPPVMGESAERRAALLLLDNVFHETDAVQRPAVQAFFIERTKAVCAALGEKRVTEGACIWKLYNHGFIVRTASATIAFDIVTGKHLGADGLVLQGDAVDRLAQECDALFISHFHGDHTDPVVAEAFIRHEKPVSVPPGLWRDETFKDGLTYLERDANRVQTVPIQGGKAELSVICYPGHQGELTPNNVVAVSTPDGMTFVHTGDQSNVKDFAWIDAAGQGRRIDVLMPNCWSPDLPRVIAGFQPALVIPGHENELGHTIDHREPYWLDLVRLGNEAARAALMTWGESYDYVPEKR